jgi:hypothetical protein
VGERRINTGRCILLGQSLNRGDQYRGSETFELPSHADGKMGMGGEEPCTENDIVGRFDHAGEVFTVRNEKRFRDREEVGQGGIFNRAGETSGGDHDRARNSVFGESR